MAIRIFFVVLLALGAAAMAEDVVRVPSQIGNLQTAIAVVPDGGTIEMDGGTYNSPTAGFRITNSDKSFTIRSAPGGRAVLNGGSVRPVLRYENSVNDPDHQIAFEGLGFTNGLSVTGGVGGGVTVARANATFVDCSFEGNHSNAVDTGGGAEPAATLQANPQSISPGGSATIQWNTVSGTFLDLYIDHGAHPGNPAASGSVIVSPSVTTTYRMVVVTEEGGASAQVIVYVDEDPALIFSDGFESGNTSSWSASSP